uniref:Uncharacterized protein n=1 Tax=Davidia involucrata TaxID=16924 RepID=A0A5B6YLQ6_DAVIN
MATVSKLHISPLDYHRTGHPPPVRPGFRRNLSTLDSIFVIGQFNGRRGVCMRPCRSFRSEEGGDAAEKETESARKCGNAKENYQLESKKGIKVMDSLKSAFLGVSTSRSRSKEEFGDALEKLEERVSAVATQIGRYIVTMMSTGVILLIGFQLSGGDSQMNALIWYSWLGGIIIGTMTGANMVLDEVSRAGPRNVVITGRYPSLWFKLQSGRHFICCVFD